MVGIRGANEAKRMIAVRAARRSPLAPRQPLPWNTGSAQASFPLTVAGTLVTRLLYRERLTRGKRSGWAVTLAFWADDLYPRTQRSHHVELFRVAIGEPVAAAGSRLAEQVVEVR